LAYDIDIVLPDGTVRRYPITGKRTILGRSPIAGISLASDDLEPEHILLMPSKDGMWVSVSKRARTALIVGGQPFSHGVLPWGTQACLGTLKLILVQEQSSRRGNAVKINPGIVVLGILVLGLVLWSATKQDKTTSYMEPPAAPPLFGSASQCSNAKDRAEARALDLAAQADAKAQRSVFAPQDGVTAVKLYREAESCFRTSGFGQQAQTLVAKRHVLEKRLNEDYVASRLRLETLREQKEWKKALAELAFLKALLSEQRNPYADWLTQTERHVQMQLIEGEP
jgi:hypothetical protein